MTTPLRWLVVALLLIVSRPSLAAQATASSIQHEMSWNYRVSVANQPKAIIRVRVQAAYQNSENQWVLVALVSPPLGAESHDPAQILGVIPSDGCFSDVAFAFSLASGDRCASDPVGTSWVTSAALHGTMLSTGKDVTDIKVSAIGPESVLVPAGTFTALRLHAAFQAKLLKSTTGEIWDVDADYWFAPNLAAPVKVIRRFSSAQRIIAVLTEELIDSGVRQDVGVTAPQQPVLAAGYFLEFGRVYASTMGPKWIKELCDDKYPATSAANQAAYDAWQQRNQNVIEELNAQFGIMQRYWNTQPNPNGEPPPDETKIRDVIDQQREPMQKKMLESQNPDLMHVCSALPKILQSAQFDIESAHKDDLANVRKGPR